MAPRNTAAVTAAKRIKDKEHCLKEPVFAACRQVVLVFSDHEDLRQNGRQVGKWLGGR